MRTERPLAREFQLTDLFKAVSLIFGGLAIFAAILHLGAALRVLPRPRPALDMDRTILIHQAEASRTPQDADVILIGDSSCMMDVSARELSRALSRQVLNLGTLSYLDLPAFAAMVREYAAVNPGRLRTVVLLCHPEFLRRQEPIAAHVRTLTNYFAGADTYDLATWPGRLHCWLGIEVFRERILTRIVPVPLPREFSRFYGFSNQELWRYLSDRVGSAVDPRLFRLQSGQGNAEYRLAANLEMESAAFRSAIPTGVQLLVGITPAPKSFVLPNYDQKYQRMLADWSRWLKADGALAALPATLPDESFATTTHLNEAGARAYTELVTRQLEPIRKRPPPAEPQIQP